MSGDLFTLGMGQVVIARFKANGAAEVGVFLLDVFCLGVKNAFFEKLDETESEGRLEQIERHSSLRPQVGGGFRSLCRELGFRALRGL